MMDRNFSVRLGKRGDITTICSGEHAIAVEERLVIRTDRGEVDFFAEAERDGEGYRLGLPYGELTLVYSDVEGFSQRFLKLTASERLTVYRIEKHMRFSGDVEALIDHKTFRCASAAAFVRLEKWGVMTGFANPFCSAGREGKRGMVLFFEPSLILKAGESFEFDAEFVGCYPLSGRYLRERTPRTPLGDREHGYLTRYHNPSLEPLDLSEVRAMQRYAEEWLAPAADRFYFEYYMYFSPVKPQPETEEEERDYRRYIDNFVSLGGDIIVFQPLQRQTPPSRDGADHWEVFREGSLKERIFNYAKARGLRCGIYMGSAQDNVKYCNSVMNPYISSKKMPLWKKTDEEGNVSEENCIACDEFADWYLSVQKNTVEKYGLKFWDWDPGLGNGHFCCNEAHGHLAGKGGYKAFRNTQRVLKALKPLQGGMYFQAFHGMKEYGLWGMKYFDQHEAYWEQDPGFFATMYPDFSADRITANGMRQQAWWNQNYRFLPAVINHSLCHRMIQNCCDPKPYLRELFDFQGYRFSVMSALAAGASLTTPLVPYSMEEPHIAEYARFLKKWTGWARENFSTLKHCVAFGSQPDVVAADGFAHIAGDRGFLFLCNGNPLKSEIVFSLGEEIGFAGEGNLSLKMLYPREGMWFDDVHGRGVFREGDEIAVTVEEHSVFLFEIVPARETMLYGVEGSVKVENGTAYVRTAAYPEGTVCRIAVTNADRLVVNGEELPFTRCRDKLVADVRFGERNDRYLSLCTREGIDMTFANPALANAELLSRFYLSESAKRALEGYSYTEKLIKYAEAYGNGGNMHLAWSLPGRCLLVVPFTDAETVKGLRAQLNGSELTLKRATCWAIDCDKTSCFFADVTEFLRFGEENELTVSAETIAEGTMLGAWLSYPETEKSDRVSAGKLRPACRGVSSSNSPLLPSTPENGGVRILSATCDKFSEHGRVKISVKLDRPASEIARVISSCPITIDLYSQMTMNTDRSLVYNETSGNWETELIVGRRELLIIDDAALHLRAVDRQNRADDLILPVRWSFSSKT